MTEPDYLFVIACGRQKAAITDEARYVYNSTYFAVCYRYALSVAQNDAIWILSAKHGFIRPTDVIEPYDVSFGSPEAISFGKLFEQTVMLKMPLVPVYTTAGKAYREKLNQVFKDVRPIAPLPIGKAMQWMINNLGKLPTITKKEQ